MVRNILVRHREINVCCFARSGGQVEQKTCNPAFCTLVDPQRVGLNAPQLACCGPQKEICNFVVPGRRRHQDIALEIQDQSVGGGLDRQCMCQFVGPPKKLPGRMKSHDGARAILEGFAAPNHPINDHEDIVGRVSFADDCAVASVADRPASDRKNSALRAFLAALKRKWT